MRRISRPPNAKNELENPYPRNALKAYCTILSRFMCQFVWACKYPFLDITYSQNIPKLGTYKEIEDPRKRALIQVYFSIKKLLR